MSRIGKAELELPDSVKVSVKGQVLSAEGPNGKLSHQVHDKISFQITDKKMTFTRHGETKEEKALHGTNRAIVANILKGVSEGFRKQLEIVGVGYRAEQKGKGINLLLGYSHPIAYEPPEGITLKVEGNNKIAVSGPDKQKVGQVAAVIRGFRKPEPYKGKGIRYSDEYVRRKEVKKS
ncbi:50S ribosomal protein L6 [Fibrobacterota bacterium]